MRKLPGKLPWQKQRWRPPSKETFAGRREESLGQKIHLKLMFNYRYIAIIIFFFCFVKYMSYTHFLPSRCTGYRAIVEGFRTLCSDNSRGPLKAPAQNGEQGFEEIPTFSVDDLKSYSASCDPVSPAKEMELLHGQSKSFASSEGIYVYV